MVKVQLISYANKDFVKHQDRLNKSAKKYGIDNIISYKESDLKLTKFYDKYKLILDQPRGVGYWLWKPFFIYKTLKQMEDNDFLIYIDSGAVFINSPLPLLKIAKKENILLFTNEEQNIKWNKYECLTKMNCNTPEYINNKAKQVTAGFQVYLNNERTREFVKEWLMYCCKPNLIDDNINTNDKYLPFKEHRHDQAILTNLAIKYNVSLYRDPSQGGNYLKPKEFRRKGEWLAYPYRYKNIPETERFSLRCVSGYLTIINHLRNASKFRLLLIKLHMKLPRWIKIIIKKR